jgi:hypothetical protein
MNNAYIKSKRFAIAIAMGLLVYLVLSGVRLAERYVEAKEIETRYEIVQGGKFFIVDKKEFKIYMNTKDGNFIPYDYDKMRLKE